MPKRPEKPDLKKKREKKKTEETKRPKCAGAQRQLSEPNKEKKVSEGKDKADLRGFIYGERGMIWVSGQSGEKSGFPEPGKKRKKALSEWDQLVGTRSVQWDGGNPGKK